MRDWLRLYCRLKPFSLTVNYRLIDRYPFLAAWRMMRFLFPDVGFREALQSFKRHSKAEVKKQMDLLPREGHNINDLGLTWYDTNTFLHRRHVSALQSRSAEERLSSDQVIRIRMALADDISAAGL